MKIETQHVLAARGPMRVVFGKPVQILGCDLAPIVAEADNVAPLDGYRERGSLGTWLWP